MECTLPQTKKTDKHEKHREGLRGWAQRQCSESREFKIKEKTETKKIISLFSIQFPN